MFKLFINVFAAVLGLSALAMCIALPFLLPDTHIAITLLCGAGATSLAVLAFLTFRPLFKGFLSDRQ